MQCSGFNYQKSDAVNFKSNENKAGGLVQVKKDYVNDYKVELSEHHVDVL